MCNYAITTFICQHTLTEITRSDRHCQPLNPCTCYAWLPISSNQLCEDCILQQHRTNTRDHRRARSRSRQPRPRGCDESCWSHSSSYSSEEYVGYPPREKKPYGFPETYYVNTESRRDPTGWESHHHPDDRQWEQSGTEERWNREERYQHQTGPSGHGHRRTHKARPTAPPPPPPPPPTAPKVPILNPYTVLGVPRNADQTAIRKAYRQLILTCHPDKVRDESKKDEAQKRFREVQEAYECLIDAERRKEYDGRL